MSNMIEVDYNAHPDFPKRGNRFWYIKGTALLHREDGPAIEFANGNKDWYYHGKKIPVDNQEDFWRYIKLINFE